MMMNCCHLLCFLHFLPNGSQQHLTAMLLTAMCAMIFSANRSCRTNPFHGTQRGRRTCIFLRMWGGFGSSLPLLLLLRILLVLLLLLLLLLLGRILLLLLQLRLLLLVLLLALPMLLSMLHMQLQLCFHPSEGAEVAVAVAHLCATKVLLVPSAVV